MEYTNHEVAKMLGTCSKTIMNQSLKLSVGIIKNGRKYFNINDIEQIKQNIRFIDFPKIISDNGTEAILSIKEYKTIIDSEDIPKIIKHGWNNNGNGYFCHNQYKKNVRTIVYLHRFIMNAPKGMEVDHINGDKLDNRKCNLRICTRSENQCNKKSNGNKSGYKGVSYIENLIKYRACIKKDKKLRTIGFFSTAEEAHAAYCKAAKELHGEFAKTT